MEYNSLFEVELPDLARKDCGSVFDFIVLLVDPVPSRFRYCTRQLDHVAYI